MNSEKSCSNCKHKETCATNYCDAVWDRAYNIRDGKDCWTPNENQILNSGEDMSTNFMKRETSICKYVCDRYYIVDYNYYGCETTVKGLLLNYYSGNIVLLSEEGIYHIKYKDVLFMKPIKMPSLDKFNEGYQELLKVLQEDGNRIK
jgi:hypothetical protein